MNLYVFRRGAQAPRARRRSSSRSSNTSRDAPPRARRSSAVGLSAALAAASSAGAARAMDPDRAMSQYVRDRWGTERGFPGGTVLAISQTADGYLWIGTDRGLLRFDGSTFREFMDPARASKPAGQVLGADRGRAGHPVGEAARGPGRPLPRRRVRRRAVPGDHRGCRDRDGARERRRPPARRDRQRRAALGSPGASRRSLPARCCPARSPVISMVQAPDGRIWMGTHGEGLFYLRDGKVVAVTENLPGRQDQRPAAGGRAGRLGGHGHRRRRAGTGPRSRREGLDPALRRRRGDGHDRRSRIERLDRDRSRALACERARRRPARARESGAAGDRALRGPRGQPLGGTSRRARAAARQQLHHLRRGGGLPRGAAGPVHVDAEGRTWFAPSSGGLYWLRGGRRGPGRRRRARATTSCIRSPAAADGRGSAGGTAASPACPCEGDSSRRGRIGRATGWPATACTPCTRAATATVWAGTLGSGVSRFHEGRFTSYSVGDGLASNTVTSIADTADGTTWVATPNGLSALAGGRWTDVHGSGRACPRTT